MKWSELHEAAKALISAGASAIVTLAGVLTWAYANFTPDADFTALQQELKAYQTIERADLLWAQHQQAINCKTVADLRAEIRRIRELLRRDQSLSEADRAYYLGVIEDIKSDIARIDPNGIC